MNIAWNERKSNVLFSAQRPVIFIMCSLNSDFDMFLPQKQFYYFFKLNRSQWPITHLYIFCAIKFIAILASEHFKIL